jgi:hypothetical protein
MDDFEAQHISNVFYALAKLGHRDEELVAALCRAAVLKVNEFNSQGIANVFNALAIM